MFIVILLSILKNFVWRAAWMDWFPFHHPTDNFWPFVRWLEKIPDVQKVLYITNGHIFRFCPKNFLGRRSEVCAFAPKGPFTIQRAEWIEVSRFCLTSVCLSLYNGQNSCKLGGSAKNFPSIAKAADMAIRKATKHIAKTPGGVVLQCTGSINTDELIRIVDDRAVRSVVSTGFGFDVIALEENGSLLFARRYKKWAAPPPVTGRGSARKTETWVSSLSVYAIPEKKSRGILWWMLKSPNNTRTCFCLLSGKSCAIFSKSPLLYNGHFSAVF